MSPKKYWKNGSLLNGLFGRRSGCSDEMLVTASTVRAATSVKSGPLGSGRDAGVADAGCAEPVAGAAVGLVGRPHAPREHEARGEAGERPTG